MPPEILYVSKAEREPEVQPPRIAGHVRREPEALVGSRSQGRLHPGQVAISGNQLGFDCPHPLARCLQEHRSGGGMKQQCDNLNPPTKIAPKRFQGAEEILLGPPTIFDASNIEGLNF